MLTKPEIFDRLENLRKAGKTIIFTNGCFDIIHRGHIEYLEEAKKLGDILVVGLNSDTSVTKLKGENRPVQNQDDREAILNALSVVDAVIIFEEETPLKLINELKPDILVKGGDYTQNEIVGAREVKGWNGSVVAIPYIEGHSTSRIIRRLLGQNNG
jgi:D-beta-D-heptose 7-phosphate kinase/D-beta-D-heptose 1-phosphate adenosyltransferase